MKKLFLGFLFPLLSYFLLPVASSFSQQQDPGPQGTSQFEIVMPNYHYEYVPDFTYQQVEGRIKAMNTSMPFELNDRIFSFIQYFTVRNREYMKMILARKEKYFPMYVETLEQQGLPIEIQYLSIVESGLDPKIKSRMGAMGLWQFMPATGRMYGMHVNEDIDDRMDPVKSTVAAAKYLKSLYDMFGNWEVALAAYNCGPGNVRKAIRRSGGKSIFWEIYDHLPRETRSYVPQFQAMLYILNHLEAHNLNLEEPTYPLAYEEVNFDKAFHLEKLAELSSICLNDLEELNPSIKNRKIPESNRSLSIRIPKSKALFVKENLAWIGDSLATSPSTFLASIEPQPTTTLTQEPSTTERIAYKVKSGDVLGKIAGKFGVSITQIKQWNNLSSSTIRVGQMLYIYSSSLASNSSASGGQPLALSNESSSTPKTYTVQPGDSLWNISKKHSLTIDQIKRLNNLNSTTIKPGQRLIIG
ncbi:MAG: LysM peptidoglycan-binding domain-containing protein [Bacteroidetes bacterium]|nr:LysM peptidoglycan-binding domain-containing protein [Bacteroidota bacterium]